MSCIVADAGPLIALARIDQLSLLQKLYGEILVPARVFNELQVNGDRPGARALRRAFEDALIRVVETGVSTEKIGRLPVDPGEAEAILFAQGLTNLRFLLIDDRRGRRLAKQRGLPIVGTGGILILAKRHGFIQEVRPILDHLIEVGYFLAPQLSDEVLRLAGELND